MKKNLTIEETFVLAFKNHQNSNFKVAENLYNEILEEDPDNLKTIFFLGTLSAQSRKFNKAKKLLQKAIGMQPNHADAHNNLGNVLKELREYKNAKICYQKAIHINPKYAEAHNNLGVILFELEEFQQATNCYHKAIEINPNYANAFYNLGIVFKMTHEFQKSINSYKKAIEINPNYLDAHNNLGIVFAEIGERKKAINCYQKALEINPNYADAYYNLGTVFEKLSELKKSIEYYKKAIEIQPNHSYAYNNLLFGICWSNNSEKYLEFARKYYDTIPKYHDSKFIRVQSSNEKILKVGFVSGDFRNHAVGYYLLDTIKNLSKKNLRLFAYSNNKTEDKLTKLLRQYFDNWFVITNETEKSLVNLIRKDNLDILFDLSGHTKNNKLPIFKNRCAEVQVTWSGWLASTGIKEIDYIIGDIYSTPLSDQWKFVEKIYQLKQIWQCMSISNLNSQNLPIKKNNNKIITFGSFNNCLKINENVVAVWSKILNSIPNSKLILKFSSFDILEVKENFLRKFISNGVDQNKIVFSGQSPRSEYLEYYNNIDIVLDTFPVNGGTISFEAAYKGVPVLTKISEKSFWFRSGESINNNLNMTDWIAKNEDDYVAKAIKFSGDKNYLFNLKSELRDIALKSALFDSKNFSNNFYEMLLDIVKK